MEQRQLRELLERVAAGETAVDEAEQALRIAPFTELGYATVDNHRGMRQGVSEVVYGAGKTAEQIAGVCRALVENGRACAGHPAGAPKEANAVQTRPGRRVPAPSRSPTAKAPRLRHPGRRRPS